MTDGSKVGFTQIEKLEVLPGPKTTVGIGRSKPYRAIGISEGGRTHNIIVKPLRDDLLATEIVCRSLARFMGVETPSIFLAELESNPSLAFASEEIRLAQPIRSWDDGMTSRMCNLSWYPAAAALDIWSGVQDRIPANILAIGERFSIIDYDDGLSGIHSPSQQTRGELASLGLESLCEIDKQRRLSDMEKAVIVCNERIEDLMEAMPLDLPEPLLSSVAGRIKMLQDRYEHLHTLFRHELGLRQHDLFTAHLARPGDIAKKKH